MWDWWFWGRGVFGPEGFLSSPWERSTVFEEFFDAAIENVLAVFSPVLEIGLVLLESFGELLDSFGGWHVHFTAFAAASVRPSGTAAVVGIAVAVSPACSGASASWPVVVIVIVVGHLILMIVLVVGHFIVVGILVAVGVGLGGESLLPGGEFEFFLGDDDVEQSAEFSA